MNNSLLAHRQVLIHKSRRRIERLTLIASISSDYLPMVTVLKNSVQQV